MTPKIVRAALASLTSLAGTKAAVALTTVPSGPERPTRMREAETGRYTFAYDGVLGTSFDLTVQAARPGEAEQAERAALAEIERLRGILSTYDPTSEISRFQSGANTTASSELREVLAAYALWSARSGGAIDPRLNRVSRLWREAARTGLLPDDASLRAALHAADALNVDALGKGFIIDRAVAAARRHVSAGLLNLGGDVRAWGEVDWLVGVADPFNSAENAAPLAVFSLRNAAVATSGNYARFVTVAGERYSHVIDPRTLRPVADVPSATVIAADAVTANALSTAASVLGGSAVSALADFRSSFGHLIVGRTGFIHRGGLLAAAAPAAGSSTSASAPLTISRAAASVGASASAWPADFQVRINVAIGANAGATAAAPAPAPTPEPGMQQGGPGFPGGMGRGRRGGPGGQKRAYVAIWIEDAQHKLVRTVTVLGDNSRYVPELTAWYQAIGHADQRDVHAVTRATRANGLYTFAWDGLDNAGQPLPQGTYTVKVEINREHGRHVTTAATITCDGKAHSVDLPASAESAASTVEYGPKSAAPAP